MGISLSGTFTHQNELILSARKFVLRHQLFGFLRTSLKEKMTPTKSYRIWFTQRNGSTLLCKGLESTGIAGIPGEYFNLMEAESLCEKYQVKTYDQLKAKLWELGTTPNGVFGIKHSMFTSRWKKIFEEILRLQNIDPADNINQEEVLADIFPNCKHIFLTRRNKIRQAVSWWKAIKDQVWHIEAKDAHQNGADFYEENYDFDALSHLLKEAVLRECAIQQYFSTHHITPLTFVYEDFIQDFPGTIKTIVDFLEVDAENLHIGEMFYSKTANEQSEQWVQRFRKDLQKNWKEQTW